MINLYLFYLLFYNVFLFLRFSNFYSERVVLRFHRVKSLFYVAVAATATATAVAAILNASVRFTIENDDDGNNNVADMASFVCKAVGFNGRLDRTQKKKGKET